MPKCGWQKWACPQNYSRVYYQASSYINFWIHQCLCQVSIIIPCTRYGFNSHGHKVAQDRLKEWRKKQSMKQRYNDKHVGVNLGKNKSSLDSVNDYVQGIECLGPFADYIVINVSSPNTPGLRDMQRREQLAQLLNRVTILPCSYYCITCNWHNYEGFGEAWNAIWEASSIDKDCSRLDKRRYGGHCSCCYQRKGWLIVVNILHIYTVSAIALYWS